jgi:hypothetical protein
MTGVGRRRFVTAVNCILLLDARLNTQAEALFP